MGSTIVIYEQPLNEHIRFCLRLEHLFQKVKNYLEDHSNWDSRTALETILEILSVVDRPDLKTKLSKALSCYATTLTQLLNRKLPEDVDEKKLRRIIDQLNKLINNLHLSSGKIGQSLRENEFLNIIQQRLSTAGGTSAFSTPAYHLWLQQSPKSRLEDLNKWFDEFTEIKITVALLLKLTRESADFEKIKAQGGFCQMNLDPNLAYQMVRLALPVSAQIYPEISVGRHRLSVHFYALNVNERATQVTTNVEFELACCKV
jgi:cell division protein ZapD